MELNKTRPLSRIFLCLWLACKNLRLLFGLAEKHKKRTFYAKKIRILRILRLYVRQKALVISLDGKKWEMQFTTTASDSALLQRAGRVVSV